MRLHTKIKSCAQMGHRAVGSNLVDDNIEMGELKVLKQQEYWLYIKKYIKTTTRTTTVFKPLVGIFACFHLALFKLDASLNLMT